MRIPSPKRRITALTSVMRMLRHNPGCQAPRGSRRLINPNRASYNRTYNRTPRGCLVPLLGIGATALAMLFLCLTLFH